jgi:hypothetical protein
MCLRDPKHVEWVKSFMGVLEEMRKYVMEYHTTGLSWNPRVWLLHIRTDSSHSQ